MDPIKLSVEIHCSQPSWAKMQPVTLQPSYRLYLNNELIAERSWRYGDDYLISEEIYARLEYEKDYELKLEPLLKIATQANFLLANFNVLDRESIIITNDDLHVSFKLR